jgi:hypothetical protein
MKNLAVLQDSKQMLTFMGAYSNLLPLEMKLFIVECLLKSHYLHLNAVHIKFITL